MMKEMEGITRGNLNWFKKVYLSQLSVADLYAMFQFVSLDYNRQFGNKIEARKIIDERYRAILQELNHRVYNCDPYTGEIVVIEGDNPEEIDLDKFDE